MYLSVRYVNYKEDSDERGKWKCGSEKRLGEKCRKVSHLHLESD